MLVNVKFFKRFIIFILLSTNLSATEKDQIVFQLNSLNSLEFTFDQIINNKTEKGSCLLKFPGKLKCNYFDEKKKELVINNKKLAITQKKYNKTYYYPVSDSPFLSILYKDKLLKIVKSGKLELSNQIINLSKNISDNTNNIDNINTIINDLDVESIIELSQNINNFNIEITTLSTTVNDLTSNIKLE